jgi:hypothetical protein
MEKVEKSSNSVCYTPSSEPYAIYIYLVSCRISTTCYTYTSLCESAEKFGSVDSVAETMYCKSCVYMPQVVVGTIPGPVDHSHCGTEVLPDEISAYLSLLQHPFWCPAGGPKFLDVSFHFLFHKYRALTVCFVHKMHDVNTRLHAMSPLKLLRTKLHCSNSYFASNYIQHKKKYTLQIQTW